MYRVSFRLARAAATVLGATFLLSGCMAVGHSGPAGLGGGMHRSIKDDPEPAAATLPAPQPPAKKAVLLPPPRPQQPRQASPKRPDMPSCETGSACMVRLKAMIDDPSRSWIGKPQSSLEYANGTRLFAYRALHGQLTCSQLTVALGEIATMAKTFRVSVAGVSSLQANRVLALGSEVEQELRAEVASRCKG